MTPVSRDQHMMHGPWHFQGSDDAARGRVDDVEQAGTRFLRGGRCAIAMMGRVLVFRHPLGTNDLATGILRGKAPHDEVSSVRSEGGAVRIDRIGHGRYHLLTLQVDDTHGICRPHRHEGPVARRQGGR